MIVKRPASKVTQGNLVLYATSLRVRDLREPGFYQIEKLDSEDRVGYQRLCMSAERSTADYTDAHKERGGVSRLRSSRNR